jgi:AcrR family transcriptional regulator
MPASPPPRTDAARTSEATVLERQLQEGAPPARATALDAFKLARRKFLAGERIDMGSVAAELGVNRVTLYRWVGTREKLLAEVIWSTTKRTLEIQREHADATGGERIAQILSGFVDATITNPGWRRLLAEEGELTMRLLTRSDGGFQRRIIGAFRDLLAEEADAGRLDLPVDLDDLAYALVRIAESYVYRELITGEQPDARGAEQVMRLLLR